MDGQAVCLGIPRKLSSTLLKIFASRADKLFGYDKCNILFKDYILCDSECLYLVKLAPRGVYSIGLFNQGRYESHGPKLGINMKSVV